MKHDKTPYGNSLATQVSVFLENGGYIAHCHRDYCGMGLIFDTEKQAYVYGSVQDGRNFYPDLVFDKRKDFIKWLSEQSDESFSGIDITGENAEWLRDNQRLNKERLKNLPALDTLERESVGVDWSYYQK